VGTYAVFYQLNNHMGKSLTKAPAYIERARRLSLFCKEVKRFLYSECLDRNITPHQIDFFVEDLYQTLEYHEADYALDRLLVMLLSDDFREEAMLRYVDHLA
jgi:hypothetical protein